MRAARFGSRCQYRGCANPPRPVGKHPLAGTWDQATKQEVTSHTSMDRQTDVKTLNFVCKQ